MDPRAHVWWIRRQTNLYSLLDTKPLRRLIDSEIPFWRIGDNIKDGCIDAVEITPPITALPSVFRLFKQRPRSQLVRAVALRCHAARS